MAEAMSRAEAWRATCEVARESLTLLELLRAAYEEERDALPEEVHTTPLWEAYEAVVAIDVRGALETVKEAEELTLPGTA